MREIDGDSDESGDSDDDEEEEEEEEGEGRPEDNEQIKKATKLISKAGVLLTRYQLSAQRLKQNKRAAPFVGDIMAAAKAIAKVQQNMMQHISRNDPDVSELAKLNTPMYELDEETKPLC